MLVVLHPLGCTMSECEPGCGDCFPVPVPEFGTTQTRLVGSSSPAPSVGVSLDSPAPGGQPDPGQ